MDPLAPSSTLVWFVSCSPGRQQMGVAADVCAIFEWRWQAAKVPAPTPNASQVGVAFAETTPQRAKDALGRCQTNTPYSVGALLALFQKISPPTSDMVHPSLAPCPPADRFLLGAGAERGRRPTKEQRLFASRLKVAVGKNKLWRLRVLF
jgi:hypothetical protein